MTYFHGIQGPSKEHLEAARMSELLRQPVTDTASALIEQLQQTTLAYEAEHHPRKQKWRHKDLKTLYVSMGALLADLLIHASNEASAGFMYRSTARGEFTDTYCSSRHYDFLLKLWSEMDWIQHLKGFQKNDDFEGTSVREFGKAGRLRATPRLIDLARDVGIELETAEEHFPKDHSMAKPIQVTTRKTPSRNGRMVSNTMKPADSAKLKMLTQQISNLNAYLEQHQFSLTHTPQFKRTFHNGDDVGFDYDQGGRLYCISEDNYQSKPKNERLNILIDGEPCVEIDVSSSFLLIFHWLCGYPFDGATDPYVVEGVERIVVKKLIVARFGASKWPTQWPKGFKGEYLAATGRKLDKNYMLRATVLKIRQALPVLNEIDQTKNGWAQLQYWESKAVLGAILDLQNNHDIVALPVHDSLVVKRKHTRAASMALQESYTQLFDFTPDLKTASPDG